MPAPERRVDVVIVNWNTAQKAVESANGYATSQGVETRVTIVDNDSVESQARILEAARADGIEVIEAGSNLGFGAAANLGVNRGEAEYVLISNADVMPRPDTVAAMVNAAAVTRDVGLVGPVFGEGGDIYHDDLPSPFILLVRTFVGGYGRKAFDLPGPGRTAPVEQPSGACFLMERATWQAAGGFDDGYFLWYEDVDLARRLHDDGHNSLIVGDARVNHVGGESFGKVSARTQQSIRLDSLGRYLKLHHRFTHLLARPLLWLSGKLRGDGSHRPGQGAS